MRRRQVGLRSLALSPGSYGGTDTDSARTGGLGSVNVLEGMETFGFNFTRDAIDRLVQIRWQDQAKRLDDDGNPDPHGSVHLDDGFSLDFTENDAIFDPDQERVVNGSSMDLAVDGYYDGIQDTDIRLTVEDFFTLSAYGALQCKTYAWANPTETTIDTILASLMGGAGGSLGDVVSQGPGCKIASMLPRSVLPDGAALKVLFSYSRADSYDSTGLTFAGTWTVMAGGIPDGQRAALLKAEANQPFGGTWSLIALDLRPAAHRLVDCQRRHAGAPTEPDVGLDDLEPADPHQRTEDLAHPRRHGHRRRRGDGATSEDSHPLARHGRRWWRQSDLQVEALVPAVPALTATV